MKRTGSIKTGAVYVYQRVGETWIEQSKLEPSSIKHGSQFGHSVSMCGDTIVVGDNTGSVSDGPGAAYVFEKQGKTWVETAKLEASDKSGADRFGVSVSLHKDYLVVGAQFNSEGGCFGAGAAYLFKRTGGTWVEQEKLQASDREEFDYFGKSVSLDGKYIAIGAFLDYSRGKEVGATYLFEAP